MNTYIVKYIGGKGKDKEINGIGIGIGISNLDRLSLARFDKVAGNYFELMLA